MICHIVLYKMKKGTTGKDEERLAAEARQALPVLPGVTNLRVGRCLEPSKSEYALALVMDFPDRAALETYRVDPNHQKFVKETAGPLVEEVFRYDFEFG